MGYLHAIPEVGRDIVEMQDWLTEVGGEGGGRLIRWIDKMI